MGRNATLGRTQASISFVSPPPVSPVLGLPKTAPGSPSHSRLYPLATEDVGSSSALGNFTGDMEIARFDSASNPDSRRATVRRDELVPSATGMWSIHES